MGSPTTATLALAALALSGGCERVKRIEPAGESAVPRAVRDVLQRSCSCHEAEPGQANGDLSFATNVPGSLVVFGDPESSRLIRVIMPGSDVPMPPGVYEAMSDNDRAILIGWVQGLPFEDDPEAESDGSSSSGG